MKAPDDQLVDHHPSHKSREPAMHFSGSVMQVYSRVSDPKIVPMSSL